MPERSCPRNRNPAVEDILFYTVVEITKAVVILQKDSALSSVVSIEGTSYKGGTAFPRRVGERAGLVAVEGEWP
jgi:hypothetical protein